MYEKSCASSNHIKSWKDIDFGTAEYEVKKLQMRIAKAVKENRVGKIKSLQWTLTHSFYAKAIAVKKPHTFIDFFTSCKKSSVL